MQLSQQQLESYQKNGFLILENYFSHTELDIIRAELPQLFAEDTPRRILERSGAVRSIFAPHTTNKVFEYLARLPRLVEPVKQILGSEVYIHQYKVNAKVALEGDQWEWHQDFLYWHKEDNMPIDRVLSAVLFLQDVNDFNGPMLVIPNSHKKGMIDLMPHENFRSRESTQNDISQNKPDWISTLTADLKYKIDKDTLAKLVEENNIFAVKGSAGFVLLFHGSLLHASAGNLSPWDRFSVFITYNSIENTLGEVENPRPEFIAHRDFKPVKSLSDSALLEMDSPKRLSLNCF
jgi:ectoine hydroxylase-related dioxygenase (phytanoyl-CoA dioxygenase family)